MAFIPVGYRYTSSSDIVRPVLVVLSSALELSACDSPTLRRSLPAILLRIANFALRDKEMSRFLPKRSSTNLFSKSVLLKVLVPFDFESLVEGRLRYLLGPLHSSSGMLNSFRGARCPASKRVLQYSARLLETPQPVCCQNCFAIG
jgi:hypothetical protein